MIKKIKNDDFEKVKLTLIVSKFFIHIFIYLNLRFQGSMLVSNGAVTYT